MHQGIDWYMNYFPERKYGNKTVLFEKSATYFDKDLAPKRASRLLKNAKLVVILISPSDRAYSWYQHMRAKNEPTAMDYSFHQVISTPINKTSKALKGLQSRQVKIFSNFSFMFLNPYYFFQFEF